MTAMKVKLAAAALGAFGLLVATGYTSQAALASGAKPATHLRAGRDVEVL
jgi:hypothetical protein